MRDTPATKQRGRLTKERVLVVNCLFDDSRQPVRRRTKIPQALGPVYLAGAFRPELCEVRLYEDVAADLTESVRPKLLVVPEPRRNALLA